jgi:hypothetical protein
VVKLSRTRRLAVCGLAAAAVGVAVPSAASASLVPVFPSVSFPSVSPLTTSAAASTYHSVSAFRAYSSKGRLAPAHPVTLALAKRGGLPAAGGFNAVALAVTVTQATKRTTATVSPSPISTPIRVVSASPHRPVTGFTVVPVAAAGTVRVLLSGGHAQVQVVVEGYQQAGGLGTTFHPLSPARVLAPHRLGPGATRSVAIVGAPRTGLPPNGHIAAVALAVTATQPTATTAVSVYPRGQPARSGEPVVATTHRLAASGLAIVTVGAHGDTTLRNAHGHATVSADVEGYWTKDPTGASFQSVDPETVYDAKPAAKTWQTIKVAGRGGLPPASQTTAALLSITASAATAPAYLGVSSTKHGASANAPISIAAHRRLTTSVLARLSGGDVHVYASRRMSMTIKVVGWYGSTANGADVNASADSCSTPFPTGVTFAVIRATDGQPYHSADPTCFASETNEAKQLPAAPEYYMNLADPGLASTGNWNNGGPKACHVAQDYDLGCAYDYGYEAVRQAVGFAKSHGMAAGARWWIDVETGNSWGSHSLKAPGHLAANVADLQGALHYFSSHRLPAGIYTETTWWTAITGAPAGFSQVPVWGGGAGSRTAARANCKPVSITGGPAQWFTDVMSDHDVAC